MWLLLLSDLSQGHIFPRLAGTAQMQEKAKAEGCLGVINKSVGMGIPDSCTYPINFLTMRSVYPPTREIQQTRECVVPYWYCSHSGAVKQSYWLPRCSKNRSGRHTGIYLEFLSHDGVNPCLTSLFVIYETHVYCLVWSWPPWVKQGRLYWSALWGTEGQGGWVARSHG